MTMLSRRALRHCARSAWTPARLSKIFHPSGQSKRLRRASSLFPPIHPNALFTKHSWNALNRNKSANQEVMTDFWFNHFNVFIGKGADRYLLTSYERDVIRPHALGKFEDLLVATAQSPAMLFYLDNWLSVGPNSEVANGIPKHNRRRARYRPLVVRQGKGRRTGLNENYGRELMELHTLGVSGGYTQKDVTEVARGFTRGTVKQPEQGGGFTFEERMHEPGDKIILGHRIKSNGEKEGREVLHLLARQ